MVNIVSHRGFSKHDPSIIENTTLAFKEAENLGVDSIELDVHKTSDDQWVVFHDAKFINGKSISSQTFDDIVNAAEQSDFMVNSLDEVLSQFPKVDFNVECKPRSIDVGKDLANYLESKKVLDRVCVSSFSRQSLRGCRMENDDLKLGFIHLTFLTNIWIQLNKEINLSSINPFYSFTGKRLVTKAHKNDTEVHVWTVNKTKFMKKMVSRGVDAIITDYPNLGLELLNK